MDQTQTIAIAVICRGKEVLIGTMSPDAKNKLAGQACLPGVGVSGDEKLHRELIDYLMRATGLNFLPADFARILGVDERVVREDDGSQRYVRRVFLMVGIPSDLGHRNLRSAPDSDMTNVRWVETHGPNGVRALLVEPNNGVSFERTPGFVFAALNGQ